MDRLRLLVALKWKLALRGYQRDRTRLIGLAVLLVFVTPASLGSAVFTYLGYAHLPGRLPFELLNLVLASIWVLWVAVPILGFSLNESYDPTKLFVFPLSTTAIFFANVMGAFLDLPVVFLSPLLVAVVAAFARTVGAFMVTVAALALFVLQTLAFSQACLTAMLGLLKSRRFQDAATILVPLLSVGIYVGMQFLAPRALFQLPWDRPEELSNLRLSAGLQWLPSGLAAGAIEHSAPGRYALALLALLLVVNVATIALGGAVLRKVHLGEIDVGRARPRERRHGQAVAGRGPIGTALGAIPVPVRAMFAKEVRHVWREPEMKAILITFLLPVFLLVIWLRLAPTGVPPDAGLIVVALSVFGSMHLAMNAFGHDRQGLEVLLSYPTRRRDILVGKNLAAGVFMGGATLLVVAMVVALGGQGPGTLAILPFAASVLLLVLASGNYSSIFFPTRIPRRGENPYTQSVAKGCVTGLFRLLALQAAGIASLPVVGAFLGPWLSQQRLWLLLTGPLSIVYAAFVYRASLGPAERALLQREDSILQVCAARED